MKSAILIAAAGAALVMIPAANPAAACGWRRGYYGADAAPVNYYRPVSYYRPISYYRPVRFYRPYRFYSSWGYGGRGFGRGFGWGHRWGRW